MSSSKNSTNDPFLHNPWASSQVYPAGQQLLPSLQQTALATEQQANLVSLTQHVSCGKQASSGHSSTGGYPKVDTPKINSNMTNFDILLFTFNIQKWKKRQDPQEDVNATLASIHLVNHRDHPGDVNDLKAVK